MLESRPPAGGACFFSQGPSSACERGDNAVGPWPRTGMSLAFFCFSSTLTPPVSEKRRCEECCPQDGKRDAPHRARPAPSGPLKPSNIGSGPRLIPGGCRLFPHLSVLPFAD